MDFDNEFRKYQSKEDEQRHGHGATAEVEEVLAVYRVDMSPEIEQMLNVLRAIDSTTNTCFIQDLLALVFESGYRAGIRGKP